MSRREDIASRDHAPSSGAVTSGHTPGPWSLDQGDWREHACCYAYAVTGFRDGEKVTLAETNHRDARLIAAAPDLLEVCRAFVGAEDALLAQLRAAGELPDLTGQPWTLVDAMRAAIAKATGGSAEGVAASVDGQVPGRDQ